MKQVIRRKAVRAVESYWQYIVLLGAVVIVLAFMLPRQKRQAEQPSQSIQNMETALEQFMENMEKDNQELVSLVAKSQQEAKQDAERKDLRIAELERKSSALEQQLLLATRQAASIGAQGIVMTSQTMQDHHVPSSEGVHPASPQVPVMASPSAIVVDEPQDERASQANRSIQARYAELFQLYEQGKSIEAISKKLGMNKGEVQLIMQLAKQEDAANA
ncbi:DUF6115 domain-containing protein [Paenibacillus harenae]|uniref:Helix-turn-helix domain-containing protein n=1 Tax=Paenibacillus harenae TaxID=306543 RepID=A0ABT9U0F2_PAEHA|nr:hypothetical protein [Paenibacillus harenae]MDQ0113104.1 hypothetical protein [Paenibacillus harenae]